MVRCPDLPQWPGAWFIISGRRQPDFCPGWRVLGTALRSWPCRASRRKKATRIGTRATRKTRGRLPSPEFTIRPKPTCTCCPILSGNAPSYLDWQTGYGLSGANAAPTANPSGDGLPNLLKYAFGLDPNTSSVQLLPRPQMNSYTVSGQTQPYLTIVFSRQIGSGNLTYTVEATGDLTQTSTTVCTATESRACLRHHSCYERAPVTATSTR